MIVSPTKSVLNVLCFGFGGLGLAAGGHPGSAVNQGLKPELPSQALEFRGNLDLDKVCLAIRQNYPETDHEWQKVEDLQATRKRETLHSWKDAKHRSKRLLQPSSWTLANRMVKRWPQYIR